MSDQAYLDSFGVTGSGAHGDASNPLKYVNSDRDLSLPLEKHKALDAFYDSQEDGEY